MIRIPEGEVEIVRIDGTVNAQPILAALRAHGISARTVGEALGSVYGLTLDGLGAVSIVVLAEQEVPARELLARAEDGSLALGDELPPDDLG